MITTGRLTPEGFELAISRSRDAGSREQLGGLSAPPDTAFRGQIDLVWDAITLALRRVYVFGRDAAREAIDSATAKARELLADAGARFREVHDALLDRVQSYLTTVVDSVLRQVRSELQFADGRSLSLTGLDVNQRLSLGGEIGVTLESLFALTGGGEIEVSAHYGVPESTH